MAGGIVNVGDKVGALSMPAAWGLIGGAGGQAIAAVAPTLLGLSTAPLSITLGTIFAALAAIGVLRKYRRSPMKDLASDLLEADRLFVKGLIDEVELARLREAVLGRYVG